MEEPVNRNARIAIIGSGIAGSTLALALKQKGFKNVILFEKDHSMLQRRQGYGLTIQQGTKRLLALGISIIKEMDTPSFARYIFSESGDVISFFGRTFYKDCMVKKSKKFNVHLARQDLRILLIREIESQIVWKKNLIGIKYNNQNETALLEFEDSHYEADVVVGADGIYSKVRTITFNSEKENSLNYLDVIVVLGIVYYPHELCDKVVFDSSNGNVRIFCMPYSCHFGEDNTACNENTKDAASFIKEGKPVLVKTMWQLSFPLDLNSARSLSRKNNKEKLKQICMEKVQNFHSPVPEMIQATALVDMMATPVYDFDPIPLDILKKHPYTALIGDASHAMSPFKSQGANRAIIDAVTLADKLSILPIKDAISSYEYETAEKNIEKVLVSRGKVAKLHSDDYFNRTEGVPNSDLAKKLKDLNVGAWTKNLDRVIKSHVTIPHQPKK
eukprot:g6115.t1